MLRMLSEVQVVWYEELMLRVQRVSSVTVAGSTCKGGTRLCGLTLLYSGIDPLL